jgi:hypothetical protein
MPEDVAGLSGLGPPTCPAGQTAEPPNGCMSGQARKYVGKNRPHARLVSEICPEARLSDAELLGVNTALVEAPLVLAGRAGVDRRV